MSRLRRHRPLAAADCVHSLLRVQMLNVSRSGRDRAVARLLADQAKVDAFASHARQAAWAAARVAARVALAPTVKALQDSILSTAGLLDRMLPLEIVRMPVVDDWREVCELVS